MSISVVTYATHSERYFPYLEKYWGSDLVVMGWGKPWNHFSDKQLGLLEFCRTCPPDRIVCFVDAFDSIPMCPISDLYHKYTTAFPDHPLVFAEDIPASRIHAYGAHAIFGPPCPTTNRFLCAGAFIGTAKDILNFWGDIIAGEDDQRYAAKRYDQVRIDTQHVLFLHIISNTDMPSTPPCVLCGNSRENCLQAASYYRDQSMDDDDMMLLLRRCSDETSKKRSTLVPYRLRYYGRFFIPELVGTIMTLVLLAIMIRTPSRSSWYIFTGCIIVMWSAILTWQLDIKHLPIAHHHKLMIVMIETMHEVFTVVMMGLILLGIFYQRSFLIVNLIYLLQLFTFMHHRRCIFSIWADRYRGHATTYQSGYSIFYQTILCQQPRRTWVLSDDVPSDVSWKWLHGRRMNLILIIALNLWWILPVSSKSPPLARSNKKSR